MDYKYRFLLYLLFIGADKWQSSIFFFGFSVVLFRILYNWKEHCQLVMYRKRERESKKESNQMEKKVVNTIYGRP